MKPWTVMTERARATVDGAPLGPERACVVLIAKDCHDALGRARRIAPAIFVSDTAPDGHPRGCRVVVWPVEIVDWRRDDLREDAA